MLACRIHRYFFVSMPRIAAQMDFVKPLIRSRRPSFISDTFWAFWRQIEAVFFMPWQLLLLQAWIVNYRLKLGHNDQYLGQCDLYLGQYNMFWIDTGNFPNLGLFIMAVFEALFPSVKCQCKEVYFHVFPMTYM